MRCLRKCVRSAAMAVPVLGAILLATTTDAAVRDTKKGAARIAARTSTATPVEHEGVPPMLNEGSSVEGYYPLSYRGDLIEVRIVASLGRSARGEFTIAFPLSTARASDADFAEQIDDLDDALALFNMGISGSADR